jgi:uncharacterized membrane protein
MLALVVAVLGYTGTAIFMKWGTVRGAEATDANLAFRVSSCALALIWVLSGGQDWQQPHLPTAIWLGVACGLLAFGSGYAGLRALDFGSLNLTWCVVRLSTVIPVLASIIWWGELRGADIEPAEVVRKLLGIGLMLAALVLLGRGRSD